MAFHGTLFEGWLLDLAQLTRLTVDRQASLTGNLSCLLATTMMLDIANFGTHLTASQTLMILTTRLSRAAVPRPHGHDDARSQFVTTEIPLLGRYHGFE